MSKSFIKSVSVSEEMSNFLDEHKEISVSKIIQTRLMEIMEFQRQCENCIKAKNLSKELKKRIDFIEKKRLTEEFLNATDL